MQMITIESEIHQSAVEVVSHLLGAQAREAVGDEEAQLVRALDDLLASVASREEPGRFIAFHPCASTRLVISEL